MAFGDCQTPEPVPLTPDEICQGFAKCGQPGLRLNPTNMTRVIAYLEALAGTDIDTLAAALCANPIFQQCVLDLTTASTHGVVSVVAAPLSAPEGAEFCLTVTIDSPVVNQDLQIPVSLLPIDEQLQHNYVVPPFLIIPVGETEGFVCVTTINDAFDEPDRTLVFHLGPTPRLPGWPGGDWAVTVLDNDETGITAPPDTASMGEEGTPLGITYGTFFTSLGGFPALSADGLPPGAVFTDNGDGTYTITGDYPTAPSSTVVTITATAPDADDATIEHEIISTCVVTNVPVIPDIEAETGEAFTYTSPPTLTGSAPITLAPDEALPPSATFTDNGDGTFTIEGPVDDEGTYSFNVIATNVCGDETPMPVTLEIAAAPPTYTVLDTSVTPFPSGGQGTDVCFSLEVFPVVTGASIFVPFALSGTEQDENSYPFPATIEIEVGQSVAAFCVTTADDATVADQVLTGTFGTFPEAPSFAGEALSTTLEGEP